MTRVVRGIFVVDVFSVDEHVGGVQPFTLNIIKTIMNKKKFTSLDRFGKLHWLINETMVFVFAGMVDDGRVDCSPLMIHVVFMDSVYE